MIELAEVLSWGIRLVGAYILALPIGWDREHRGPSMGLRTFPLVAIGACGYVLLGQTFIEADQSDAMARILQGLMTGIGFVGGGAILKDDDRVRGTASAASVWVMGAQGAAMGFGNWPLALLLTALDFGTIYFMKMFKGSDADE